MKLLRLISALGLLLALGCGNENKTLTATEFSSQYVQVVCEAVYEACVMPFDTCAAWQSADRTKKAQEAAGKRRLFMPPSAEACLAKASSTYSQIKQNVALRGTDLQDLNQVCDFVYRGSSQANQQCDADADCIVGLICDKGFCGTKTTVLANAGCANIGETCPPGHYCALSVSTGLRTCQPKLGVGSPCDVSALCLENLRCAANVCVDQVGMGEVCTADQDCNTGFCEPYAGVCANDVRFARHSDACVAMGGS
jgi:hypothetical protein